MPNNIQKNEYKVFCDKERTHYCHIMNSKVDYRLLQQLSRTNRPFSTHNCVFPPHVCFRFFLKAHRCCYCYFLLTRGVIITPRYNIAFLKILYSHWENQKHILHSSSFEKRATRNLQNQI